MLEELRGASHQTHVVLLAPMQHKEGQRDGTRGAHGAVEFAAHLRP
jgi:hypothetical protein